MLKVTQSGLYGCSLLRSLTAAADVGTRGAAASNIPATQKVAVFAWFCFVDKIS
jgi:hypothetical protein